MATSINPVLSAGFTIGSADDALAAAQTQQIATLQGLNEFAKTQRQRLESNINKLSTLKALEPQVDNLSNGKSPDGSYTLNSVDSGATLVLGSLNDPLQASLQSVGLSLATQPRQMVSTQNFDHNGKLVSATGTHVADAAETKAMASGTTVTEVLSGTTYNATTVGTANGSTVYLYDPKAAVTTASLTDLKVLQSAVLSSESTTGSDIQDETQSLASATERLQQFARLGDAQYTALSEQSSKAEDRRHDLRQHESFDASRLQQARRKSDH